MVHTHADIPALIAAAIDQSQVEPLLARMAPGAVVWHNTDRVETDAAASFAAVAASPMAFRIEQRRVISTPEVVVIQFVMHIAAATPLALHCCMVVSLEDGLITRIDEYLDPGAAAVAAPY